MEVNGQTFSVGYVPGDSDSGLFGGNSNWRGPIWIPMNFLLIRSLRTYFDYYGDELQTEFPTGSGKVENLKEVAEDLAKRLIWLFEKDTEGKRPINNGDDIYQQNPHFQDLVLFYEYFHGDSGKGLGASHQTGWTGVVGYLISQL